MSDLEEISVIIPFKDRFEVVNRAVESVFAQSYRPIELILIDDFSKSKFDVKQFEETECFSIKYYRNERNLGPGASRGKGREIAQGKLIAYLDSDDYWDSCFLSKLSEMLLQNENIGMAFSNTVRITQKGLGEKRLQNENITEIIPSLFFKRYWSTSSCLWRSEVSLPKNWYPYRDHEDYVHEYYCASINNYCCSINESLCFNVQDAPERIPRSNKEFLKSIRKLGEGANLMMFSNGKIEKDYSSFVLKKFYKRSISPKITEIKDVSIIFCRMIRLMFPKDFRRTIIILGFSLFWLLGFRTGLKKMINLFEK